MVKIESGVINDQHVSAVLKVGANWQIWFGSGEKLTVSPADAAAVADQLTPGKKV